MWISYPHTHTLPSWQPSLTANKFSFTKCSNGCFSWGWRWLYPSALKITFTFCRRRWGCSWKFSARILTFRSLFRELFFCSRSNFFSIKVFLIKMSQGILSSILLYLWLSTPHPSHFDDSHQFFRVCENETESGSMYERMRGSGESEKFNERSSAPSCRHFDSPSAPQPSDYSTKSTVATKRIATFH